MRPAGCDRQSSLVFLDHHLGRFDNCRDLIALLELQFLGAALGDDGLDDVVTDFYGDERRDSSQHDFRYFALQMVTRGERHQSISSGDDSITLRKRPHSIKKGFARSE